MSEWRLRTHNQPRTLLQLQGKRKDGTVFTMSLSLSEVEGAGMPFRQFVGFIRDLTEHEKMVSHGTRRISDLHDVLGVSALLWLRV